MVCCPGEVGAVVAVVVVTVGLFFVCFFVSCSYSSLLKPRITTIRFKAHVVNKNKNE